VPPAVIARLERLNECYEGRYPGLRYVTFVNGRSRGEIVGEMERFLGVSGDGDDEDKGGALAVGHVVGPGSEEWKRELGRAVEEVGLIAKSRLVKFGVD